MKTARMMFLSLAAAVLWFGFAPAAKAQGTHFHAVLVGGNETGTTGDTNGYGTAAVHFRGAGQTEVCVAIIVTGINPPTAAHIHRGFGDDAGPIVVTLNAPPTGNPGNAAICATITSALSQEIRTKPYGFYINVHTGDFPGGAVRGQLF